MKSRSDVLFAVLVAVTCFGLNDGSIQCYQCENCPDTEPLPALTECDKETLDKQIQDVLLNAGMISPSDAQSATDKHPNVCFKLAMGTDNKDAVYRGCGPYSAGIGCHSIMYDSIHVDVCICDGDGCNSAPLSYVPSLLIACLSVVIVYLYI